MGCHARNEKLYLFCRDEIKTVFTKFKGDDCIKSGSVSVARKGSFHRSGFDCHPGKGRGDQLRRALIDCLYKHSKQVTRHERG